MVRSATPEVSGGAPETVAAPPTADSRGLVVFLGTSLTEGYGLPGEELAFPALIQRRINAEALPFRVVNAGVAGDTSAGGLARLNWVLRGPADALVVELGANDGLRGLPVSALGENLRSVVRQARELHPGIAIVLVAMEAPPNLGSNYVRGFRDTYTEVAREEGAALVPFFLDGIAGVPEMNLPDGIHPTAEGHARMADRVWETLGPLLRDIQ